MKLKISWGTSGNRIQNLKEKLFLVIKNSAGQMPSVPGFIWSGKSEESTFYTRGHRKSGKVREFENFCIKSQGKSGKKIPVENEVSRSTSGFQNCFP